MSTIRLVSGGIGAAKTLWVMEQLYKLKNNHPERKVYTDITGIRHTGVESVPGDWDWREADNNSLVIFDEVQYKDLFSRHNSKRDKQILDLTTIRKRGVELWMITQRPRFLNPDVLGLVNEHVHLEKTGDKTAKVFIWNEAKTAMTKTDKLLPFDKYIWQHPEHLYGFYESIQPDAKHHKRSYFNKGIIAVVLTLLFALIPAWYVIKQGTSSGIEATSDKVEEKKPKQENVVSNNMPSNSIDLTEKGIQSARAETDKKIADCMTSFGWSHDQCREAVEPDYLKANNDAMLARTNNSMEAIAVTYNPSKPYDVQTPEQVPMQINDYPRMSGVITVKGGKLMAINQYGDYMPDVSQEDCRRYLQGYRPFDYSGARKNASSFGSQSLASSMSNQSINTVVPENINSNSYRQL